MFLGLMLLFLIGWGRQLRWSFGGGVGLKFTHFNARWYLVCPAI